MAFDLLAAVGGAWSTAGGGVFGSIALPNLIDLPTLRLTERKPGPRPKFLGNDRLSR